MARARISELDGMTAVSTALQASATRDATATAVRYLLQALADKVPGNTVEVRIPPFGAVQCVEGPRHTRGTPPNVIEMDAATWLSLATGSATWADAVGSGAVHASGTRATLEPYLPVNRPR
ncbi:sterol carrier family protein [Humibacter soli]